MFEKTIYIARPTGGHFRKIVKDDPSCLEVNDQYLKVGKALAFSQRIKDYEDDNAGMVEVVPIVDLDGWTKSEIGQLETSIKKRIKKYTCYNQPGVRKDGSIRKRPGRTEWLFGIDYDDLKQIIIEEFEKFKLLLKE